MTLIDEPRQVYLPSEPNWLRLNMEVERALCIVHPPRIKMITSLLAMRIRTILDNLAAINLISSHAVTTSDNSVIARVTNNNLTIEENTLVVTPTIHEIIDHYELVVKSAVKDICDSAQAEFIDRIEQYK